MEAHHQSYDTVNVFYNKTAHKNILIITVHESTCTLSIKWINKMNV